MKRTAFYRLIYGTVISLTLMACGEDRSGEYYALIASKTWIYETMQQNYLFYEDIPAEESLDFFQTPETFLKMQPPAGIRKTVRCFLTLTR